MENSENTGQAVKEQKVSMLRHAITYGTYTSIGFILVSLLFYVLDVNRTSWVNYLTFLLLIAGIYMGAKSYRDQISGGFLSYGRSLGIGVLISLVVGVVMGIYTYLFFQFFDPAELVKIVDAAEQQMAEKGLTDEQIDQAMAISKKFMTAPVMSVSALFGMVMYGTVFSLIISIFVKKDDDSFNSAFPQG